MDSDIPEFKVVTVGDSGVGKTSLVKRFSDGVFTEGAATTIGAAYVKVDVVIANSPICLNIWDTAGQERFQSLIPLYLRSAQACIIVVDISQKDAVSNLNVLFENFKDILPQDICLVLAGNKKDLVPDYDPTPLLGWADKNKMSCIFTSAKSAEKC
ncbi:small GTP-binding protein, putative [Trichomonas vaginalis G3]|uniref:Small GTP-binding protein, putative n=1 Tax=Trichomonas vaginalis (strain ATCC PRA-98 / G3) TaxID=412133 RepID=A2FZ42_TRIV3|nr:small GTP-binding protein, putative [Trichomonas vaginalis G3]|eukprot:XP_001302762.1 small GTP-binding protein [Trichomonas vaginalis G3]